MDDVTGQERESESGPDGTMVSQDKTNIDTDSVLTSSSIKFSDDNVDKSAHRPDDEVLDIQMLKGFLNDDIESMEKASLCMLLFTPSQSLLTIKLVICKQQQSGDIRNELWKIVLQSLGPEFSHTADVPASLDIMQIDNADWDDY